MENNNIKVKYLDVSRGEKGKRIYVPIIGIWDGEKAVFKSNLEEGTTEIVIRNFNWLEIINDE